MQTWHFRQLLWGDLFHSMGEKISWIYFLQIFLAYTVRYNCRAEYKLKLLEILDRLRESTATQALTWQDNELSIAFGLIHKLYNLFLCPDLIPDLSSKFCFISDLQHLLFFLFGLLLNFLLVIFFLTGNYPGNNKLKRHFTGERKWCIK